MSTLRQNLARILGMEELGILLVLVALVIAVAAVKPVFVSDANLINILRASAFPFIIAVAMTFVFIGGQFDLSVGPIVALGGIAAGMMVIAGVPVPLAVAANHLHGRLHRLSERLPRRGFLHTGADRHARDALRGAGCRADHHRRDNPSIPFRRNSQCSDRARSIPSPTRSLPASRWR